ncbi:MAG: methyltransferase domain-containing protein [Planctomycetota bacterium]
MDGSRSAPDVGEQHRNVRERYRTVAGAQDPQALFRYPVGRESAIALGYEAGWIEAIPAAVVERFVGVGNPLGVRRPEPGARVLDLGCGCGVDVLVAARLVGSEGKAVGLDLSPEMIAFPRAMASDDVPENASFVEGAVEHLPFDDASFDMVTSNGVLNLATDKDRVFREAARVLRPGGTFVVADLLVIDTIPEDVLSSMDAWST